MPIPCRYKSRKETISFGNLSNRSFEPTWLLFICWMYTYIESRLPSRCNDTTLTFEQWLFFTFALKLSSTLTQHPSKGTPLTWQVIPKLLLPTTWRTGFLTLGYHRTKNLDHGWSKHVQAVPNLILGLQMSLQSSVSTDFIWFCAKSSEGLSLGAKKCNLRMLVLHVWGASIPAGPTLAFWRLTDSIAGPDALTLRAQLLVPWSAVAWG